MHSFLITQSTPSQRLEYANQLADKQKISPNLLYRYLIGDNDDTSIKIEDIRQMEKWLAIKSSSPRLIIISQAQRLTLPAQHALLKPLEEPGENNFIILTADSEQSLLPTILSRCKIIRLSLSSPVSPSLPRRSVRAKAGSPLFPSYPSGLPADSPSGRIFWLHQQFKNKISRDLALDFIEKIIMETRQPKNKPTDPKIQGEILKQAALAHQRLKQNLSPVLTLEQFILDIP